MASSLAMIDKEQVLQMVKMKGFVVPSDLVRQFHVDTFIMGAVLSDLVHDKKLGVSTVKMGSSPVYYAPEQKEKLLDLVKYLNEKDKATFSLLQKQKVLSDTEQTPLVRVSLRTLKDYAKPIEVTANGETKLFWKWYLATDEEVHTTLKGLFVPQPVQSPAAPSVQPSLPVVEKEKLVVSPLVLETAAPLKKKIPKARPERQARLAKLSEVLVPIAPATLVAAVTPVPQEPLDPFSQTVQQFLQQKGITLINYHVLKKGEGEGLIDIPTPVGSVRYFFRAKQKKKCTEGDVATTYLAAQMKKYPALLLTPGEIPKKVTQKLMEDYPNMKILNL